MKWKQVKSKAIKEKKNLTNHSELHLILMQQFPFLEKEDIDAFLNICQVKSLKNKEIIFPAGSASRKVMFILSGFVRGFVINSEGEEKNIMLRAPYTFTSAPEWLFANNPTKYTFESILTTEILIFTLSDIEQLAKKNEGLFNFYINALKDNITILMYRVDSLINLSPEERYKDLLEKYPHLIQSAFNKHIANFLGITPVSLSRLIKRMKQ